MKRHTSCTYIVAYCTKIKVVKGENLGKKVKSN